APFRRAARERGAIRRQELRDGPRVAARGAPHGLRRSRPGPCDPRRPRDRGPARGGPEHMTFAELLCGAVEMAGDPSPSMTGFADRPGSAIERVGDFATLEELRIALEKIPAPAVRVIAIRAVREALRCGRRMGDLSREISWHNRAVYALGLGPLPSL